MFVPCRQRLRSVPGCPFFNVIDPRSTYAHSGPLSAPTCPDNQTELAKRPMKHINYTSEEKEFTLAAKGHWLGV